jgi:hypothetical protein
MSGQHFLAPRWRLSGSGASALWSSQPPCRLRLKLRERAGRAVDDIDERRQGERFEEIGAGAANQLFYLPRISGHQHDGDVLPIGLESDLPVWPVW